MSFSEDLKIHYTPPEPPRYHHPVQVRGWQNHKVLDSLQDCTPALVEGEFKAIEHHSVLIFLPKDTDTYLDTVHGNADETMNEDEDEGYTDEGSDGGLPMETMNV